MKKKKKSFYFLMWRSVDILCVSQTHYLCSSFYGDTFRKARLPLWRFSACQGYFSSTEA
jgi:hypothetical protein